MKPDLKLKRGYKKLPTGAYDRIIDAVTHLYTLECLGKDTSTAWLLALIQSYKIHCCTSSLKPGEPVPPAPHVVIVYIENHLAGGSLEKDPKGVAEYINTFRKVEIR